MTLRNDQQKPLVYFEFDDSHFLVYTVFEERRVQLILPTSGKLQLRYFEHLLFRKKYQIIEVSRQW